MPTTVRVVICLEGDFSALKKILGDHDSENKRLIKGNLISDFIVVTQDEKILEEERRLAVKQFIEWGFHGSVVVQRCESEINPIPGDPIFSLDF